MYIFELSVFIYLRIEKQMLTNEIYRNALAFPDVSAIHFKCISAILHVHKGCCAYRGIRTFMCIYFHIKYFILCALVFCRLNIPVCQKHTQCYNRI